MNRKAFTLAEVLITLTIIGVIAALTIPNLMQKWQDQADVAKVKEVYSILSNAMKMAISENGTMDNWDWPKPGVDWSKDNGLFLGNLMKQYLKINKFCGNGSGCFPDSCNSIKPGNTAYCGHNEPSKMILQNGMSVAFWASSPPSSIRIIVDINGLNKPNRFGFDIFEFIFNGNTLVSRPGYGYCNPNGHSYNDGEGYSCAEWILKHGNMDYKYRDVSAEW